PGGTNRAGTVPPVPRGFRGSGTADVRQVLTVRIGLPYFSWLLALPLRAYLGRLAPRQRPPWWLPPDTISRRQATLLATLCGLSVVVGYLSGLLPEVMTYVAREYHISRAGQGVDLGVVSLSSVAALPLLVMADRRGRRRLVLWCTAIGAVVSAGGALAGSASSLTALQVLAQALLSAQFVLVGVMVVEEMPVHSRALGLGAAGMCFGLGGGAALAVLPLAGTGVGGWRWIFALGLLGLPIAWSTARRLPETARFARRAASGRPPESLRMSPGARRVLLLLGAGALLLAVFDAPGGQFQNELLRTERHLSPVGISILEQTAGTLGGVGTLVGARLAESWGRRRVAAAGVALETVLTLASYFDHGVLLWATTAAGSFAAYAVAPAWGVYGGELFSTGLRSRAGGLLTVASAVGGLVGLVAVGALSSPLGGLGP
ncbi:MAG: MFS transporter, partial [Acidimicrobiales bacterium]